MSLAWMEARWKTAKLVDERKGQTQGNQSRVDSSESSDREYLGDEDTGNPLTQISRFSKKLAPYYLTLSVAFSFLGGLWGVYSQIISTINKRDQSIMDKIDAKYQVPFYKLDEHDFEIKDHEQRIRDIEFQTNAPRRKK